jgi:hypothetical protein
MSTSNVLQPAVAGICLVLAMTIACSGGSPVEPAGSDTTTTTATTFLTFASEPGEYVGNGETHTYALVDANWTALADAGTSRTTPHVQIRLIQPVATNGFFWELHFGAPAGRTLAVTAYDDAREWPFNPPPQPGLRFAGNGRACSAPTGRFAITELVLGATNSLDRFHATFEQHCNGRILAGEVAIVADPWR